MKRIIGLIKILYIVHVGGTNQAAIKGVRPRMIGTLNSRRQVTACLFNQSRSAVATHVVKAMNVSASVAQHDNTFASDLGDEVITGLRDLTLVACQDPVLREDFLSLVDKNLR